MIRIRKFIKIPIRFPAVGILLVMVLAISLAAVIPVLAAGSVGQTSLGWKNQEHKQEWNDGNYGAYPEGDYWQCQITMDNDTDVAIDITEFGIAFDFWQTSSYPTGGAVGVDWCRNLAWTMTPSDFFVKKQTDPRYPYTGDPLSPTWSGDWTPFTPAIWNMPYDPGTNWYTLTESCESPALSHFYSHFCNAESGSGIPNLLPAHTSLAIYTEPHLALTYLWSNGLGGTLPIDGEYGGIPYVRDWECEWGGAGYFSGSSMHGEIVYSGAKTFQLPSGVIVSGSVSGHKYDDKDGSGDLTAGDVGIANWPIALTGLVEGIPVGPVLTSTDSSGYYEFPDLPEGSGPFCIEEAPENGEAIPSGYEGYSHTSPSELCGIYASSTDNDFFNVGCGNVSITKTDSPSPLGCPGETITYTLTVSNTGPGTATGIYLEDTLPTNMALTDVKLNGSSTSDYSISSGVLRYPAAGGVSLDSAQSFILQILGTATDCDPLVNSVIVYADNDCSEEGNTDSTTTERNIPPVYLNVPADKSDAACAYANQAAVDAAFSTWLGLVTYGGGCNAAISNNNTGAPDFCGGTTTVEWTVTSDCEDDVKDSATFTVGTPDPLNVTCPNDYVGAYGISCSTDPEITGYPIVSGGCDPQVTYQDDIVPGDTCGWTVTRTWNITDLCESYNCTQYISCTCPACETAVAAQGPGPGQYRFGGARSWFTYIKYYTGTGHNSPGTAQEFPIFAGQTQLVGTLYVYDSGNTLYVKYSNTGAEPGCDVYFNAYHLQVDDEYNDFRSTILWRRNPVPGQCEYGGSLSNVPETGWIAADISGYGDSDVYIFAHSIACYYCAS